MKKIIYPKSATIATDGGASFFAENMSIIWPMPLLSFYHSSDDIIQRNFKYITTKNGSHNIVHIILCL